MPDQSIAQEPHPVEVLRAAAALLRERAAQATPGPWTAAFADPSGHPLDRAPGYDDETDDEDEYDTAFLSLRCGTALPDDRGRLPGAYQAHHVLAEHDDDLPREQAAELYGSLRWAATMSPDLAVPLAALFDAEAEHASSSVDLHPALTPHARWQRSVAVARVILGGAR
jgi:hypothetical protein